MDQETIIISRDTLKLLTYVGYFDRYRHHLAGSPSGRVAWAKTEAELREFGLRRFIDYDSFRVNLRRERVGKRIKKVSFIEI
jgi:hypothetical protein